MPAETEKYINLHEMHPSVLLFYFFSALLFCMLTLNPTFLLLSFLAAFLINFYLQGLARSMKPLRSFLPFHLLIILANAFFSGNGLTLLFYFGETAVTLESILYGFAAGLMLLTILLWFHAYQILVSSDQILAVGSVRFPLTSLILSMILRYVPDTIKHGEKIKMNQKALLGEEKLSSKQERSFLLRMSSVLLSWSMENSLETSIAMRAKGHPSDKRSSYKRDHFNSYDAISISFLILMVTLQLTGFFTGAYAFTYYPYLMLPSSAAPLYWRITVMIFYAIFLFFPFYLELVERVNLRKLERYEASFGVMKKSAAILNLEQEKPVFKEEADTKTMRGSGYVASEENPVLAAKLVDLSFTYPEGERKALDSISLSFERGTMTLLTGVSGSGKSSLLYLLAPALTPAGKIEGERFIYGEPAEEHNDLARATQIGFVQQNPDNQIILDSVWHELAFGLENKGLCREEIERRLAETTTYFGISDWMGRRVSELSGGEKQILNLASSLVMQPDILLLDEPMAQLDPISRKRFLSILSRLHDETGTTIIISEHIIDDLLPLADKIIMLEDASLAFEGKVDDYVRYLLKTNADFQLSLPLSARMVMATKSDEQFLSQQQLPLTVRDGRRFLERNREIVLNKDQVLDEAVGAETDTVVRENILSAKEIWFRYDKKKHFVLRGASISIKSGELHAILGGNGSGKSTLLYILSRSLPALRGKIIRPEGQQVAMLSQNPMAVFSQETVFDELMEFHKRFDYNEEKVQDLMERFKLSDLAARHPYDISGGEMQKTALAKALLTKPDLLLLDEPVKGLDPLARREVAQIFHELKSDGMTMILVTHDLDFVSRLADRCSMVFDGHVEGTATTKEFFADNAYFTTSAHRLTRGIFASGLDEKELLLQMSQIKIGESDDGKF